MKKSAEHAEVNRVPIWKKWPGVSLRNRIAFYYTVTTAILIALVFATIYVMVERVVYRQFDEQLQSEAAEVLHRANITRNDFKGFLDFQDFDDDDRDKEHEGENERAYERKKHTDVDPHFVQILTRKGEVIRKSESLAQNDLPFDSTRKASIPFNSKAGLTPVRQMQVPLVNRNGITEGYLMVALSLKSSMIVLSDLLKIFLFSFPVITLSLFVLTRFIAGKSIRPIEEVIATAEKMTQANLDQRITLPYHRDELYRMSATINALLDRLQEAFQREKQFTADASHELKTPLAAIKGTLEVLIRKPREREHYESRIQFCLTELNRMARLIDQLLMLARYERSKIEVHTESLLLTRHLEELTQRMLPFAAEKAISFCIECAESCRVAADPAMLEMMLENILSNAIKYSPARSSVTIRVNEHPDSVQCSIIDQGFGIPEEKLQAIFERFFRVDASRSSSTGGFGLGLSIVKKLADLQEIRVSVESTINRGTTFTLTFSAPPALQ